MGGGGFPAAPSGPGKLGFSPGLTLHSVERYQIRITRNNIRSDDLGSLCNSDNYNYFSKKYETREYYKHFETISTTLNIFHKATSTSYDFDLRFAFCYRHFQC